MGDTGVSTTGSVSDYTLHPGESYHGRSSSGTSESDRTNTGTKSSVVNFYYRACAQSKLNQTAISALEERMTKLEGKVDNLTGLIMQILQQLKDK
jgi:hypothetical protein